MSRRGLFLIVLMWAFLISYAQKPTTKPISKSSPYIMHVVKFGETLTKIAQKYHVTITDILKTNPSLTANNLKPEQIIRISKKESLNISYSISNELNSKVTVNKNLISENVKYHTVEAGQTLYSISKIYNIKVEDLQKWNSLTDYNLKVGSQLLIAAPDTKSKIDTPVDKPIIQDKKATTTAKPVDSQQSNEANTEPVDQASNINQKELAKLFKAQSLTTKMQTTEGTGAPMTTTLGVMESVYFAMHRTLAIGTIIKIKNLVNSRIIYAKVIGKLPDTDENKHVIVRYSLGVKKDLQLQNGKCYVQIEYPD